MTKEPAENVSKKDQAKRFYKEFFKMALVVVASALLIIVGVVYVKPRVKAFSVQISMKNYLEHKYEQKFTVSEPVLSGSGFGVPGVWGADAHPAEDEVTSFRVIRSESRGVSRFADQYVAELWSKRETADLASVLEQESADWKSSVSVDIHLAEPLSDTARPDDINTQDDILKRSYGLSYSVKLSCRNVENSLLGGAIDDAKRMTDYVRNVKEIKNLNIEYLIETSDGSMKECQGDYYRGFNFSHAEIEMCFDKAN